MIPKRKNDSPHTKTMSQESYVFAHLAYKGKYIAILHVINLQHSRCLVDQYYSMIFFPHPVVRLPNNPPNAIFHDCITAAKNPSANAVFLRKRNPVVIANNRSLTCKILAVLLYN
jgi:hypothetical protein